VSLLQCLASCDTKAATSLSGLVTPTSHPTLQPGMHFITFRLAPKPFCPCWFATRPLRETVRGVKPVISACITLQRSGPHLHRDPCVETMREIKARTLALGVRTGASGPLDLTRSMLTADSGWPHHYRFAPNCLSRVRLQAGRQSGYEWLPWSSRTPGRVERHSLPAWFGTSYTTIIMEHGGRLCERL
jgi:hypothetical protein